MICAALLIGATVLFAALISRSRTSDVMFGAPRHWLVLPDDPLPMAVLALPRTAAALSSLPAVATIYPSWSSSDESWRAEKPIRPWFRGPAPFAVAAAMGVMSLDMTGLGLGVPEIFPTHLPAAHREVVQEHAGQGHLAHLWSPDSVDLSVLFEASHASDPGSVLDHLALDQSDFIVPSWERAHDPSHDWMA